MSGAYAGNPANFPVDYTIPDDADPPTASAFNVASEALGDRTAYLKARVDHVQQSLLMYSDPTTVTEWTAGPYDTRVRLEGHGGGGGGGGGAYGDNHNDSYAAGGGGGGAPIRFQQEVTVVPGIIYEILIGDGGIGGAGGIAGGAAATAGGNGGDTIFRRKSDGVVLARFKGARGGSAGVLMNATSNPTPTINYVYIVPGGGPTNVFRPNVVSIPATNARQTYSFGPGFGGDGVTSAVEFSTQRRNGADSIDGQTGGLGGLRGTDSTYKAGGPGGGGAAGPGGAGVDGLDGGNGASSGFGGAAPAFVGSIGGNTGAGGGGGGGGGCGPSGGGNGADGIHGLTGFLTLKVIF
jgi:hypothetical protein